MSGSREKDKAVLAHEACPLRKALRTCQVEGRSGSVGEGFLMVACCDSSAHFALILGDLGSDSRQEDRYFIFFLDNEFSLSKFCGGRRGEGDSNVLYESKKQMQCHNFTCVLEFECFGL